MYSINKIGPFTEPCGTPYSILLSFEDASLLKTYCFLLFKDTIFPLKPYLHSFLITFDDLYNQTLF